MGLLEDLAAALQAASIATLSTDLFLGLMPDAPHAALALYEFAGFPPLYTHHSQHPALERPSVQLLVRDQDYATGRARMDEAYAVLCGVTTYLAIQPAQMPFALPRDLHNRPRWSVNFNIVQVGA
jgi:hypothetical protein